MHGAIMPRHNIAATSSHVVSVDGRQSSSRSRREFPGSTSWHGARALGPPVHHNPETPHFIQLQQLEPGLGRQAGNEDANIGRDPVAAAAFGFDPDQAGQVTSCAVGVARRPAAAGFDAPVVLADRVRVVVGIAGEVSGPFQGEGVLQTRVEHLVVVPDAQHVVGTADDGQGGNQENGLQGMASGLGPQGILDLDEQGNQGDRSRAGHEGNLLDGTKTLTLPRTGATQVGMRLPCQTGKTPDT